METIQTSRLPAEVRRASGRLPTEAFQPSAEESARFMRIVAEGALIRRHYELYQWLSGELQHFLPHQVLVAAWGDFATSSLKLDITSALPGVRTAQLEHCRIDDLVHHAHGKWVDAGRQPVLLGPADISAPRGCGCVLHAALKGMRSALVHGVRDERGGNESLYIALESGYFAQRSERSRLLVDWLMAQIDVAFRRVAAFPLDPVGMPDAPGASPLELSPREQQVLDCLSRGESNLVIATGLDISPHTVKNHLQRIFRKIGANNRTQAVARYNNALRSP